ncbi:hypothetical protein [Methylocapsa aurea]|uniref:hypothetical protein n=1 Tax=Methylocapsa aurea TaxID=663610 RepID=UPI003D18B0BD
MMSLRALLEESPDADFLRGMIGFAAEQLIRLEFDVTIGAMLGERATRSTTGSKAWR